MSDIPSEKDIAYQIVDEEKIDFVNGKILSKRKTSIKFIKELDGRTTGEFIAINPHIQAKRPTNPRINLMKGSVFNRIPEEESEWNDKISVSQRDKFRNYLRSMRTQVIAACKLF